MTDRDLISRTDLLNKIFQQAEGRDYYGYNMLNLPYVDLIKSMPSVQPSGDLISRKEIVDMIDKLYDDFCNSDGGETSCTIDGKTYTSDMGYAFDGIEMFIEVFKKRLAEKQTAEPKSAEWIPIIDHGKDTGYIRCSACGAGEPMARFPHCPECGAEMVNWGICKGAEE